MIKNKKNNCVSVDSRSKRFCEVCFQNQPSTHHLAYLRCIKCLKDVHCYCYRPQLINMKKDQKTFMCDLCQRKQNNHAYCNICHQKTGILKKVFEGDGYVHILCALLSDRYTIISYSKLQFKLKQNVKNPFSKNEEKSVCFLCDKAKQHPNFIKCMLKNCQNVVHTTCLKDTKRFSENQWQCVFQLLDKNNFIIRHMKQLGTLFKDYPLPPMMSHHQSKPNLVICPQHQNQQDFIYCPCNKKKQQKLVGCDQCKRWVHLSCSGVKTQKEYLKCFGCNTKDIYSKRASLPQIIGMMFSIQQSSKKTIQQTQWNFIDRFPFSLSKVLLNKIRLMKEVIFQRYVDIFMQNCQKLLPKIFKQKAQCLKIFQDKQFITWFHNLLKYDKSGIYNQQVKTSVLIKQLEDCKIISQYSKSKLKELLIIKLKAQQMQNKGLFQSIEDFNSKCKNNRNLSIIIDSLISLSQVLKQNYDQCVTIPKPLKILTIIITKGVDKNLLQCLIQKYGFLISNIEKYGIIYLPQIKYYKLHNIVFGFAKNIRNYVRELLYEYIKKVKPIRQYTLKSQLIKTYKNKIDSNQIALSQIPKINKKMSERNIYSPIDSVYQNFQTLSIYLNALKKQCLNRILQKSDSQNTAIQKISQILLNSKLNILNDCEKQILKKYIIKQKFFNTIINKYQVLKNELNQNNSQISQEINDSSSHNQQSSKNVLKILQSDILSNVQLSFATTEINKLANFNIQLNKLEKQSLRIFCQGVLIKYQQQNEIRKSLKTQLLLQVKKMIQYTNLSQRFSFYKQQYELYRKWKCSLQEFMPFETTLQKQLYCQQFKQKVQQTLIDSLNLKFNISPQIKKLKTLQLWCNITQKFFQHFNFNKKRKPTINSIQQFRDILQNSQYPKNQNYRIINELYNQVNQINIRINSFLEKTKLHQLDFYQQLKVYKNKIKISQAFQLLKTLKESRLYVLVQRQELQIQINEFQRNLQNQNIEQKNTINQLNLFRSKLIKTPIRPDCDDLYYNTVNKIYKLKCQNPQFPLSRNQFNKILNLGGNSATLILENQKGYKLYKTIKIIQRAQKQCLNQSNRNYRHLLQLSDEKKILQELNMDESERKIIQKWYFKAKRIKEKFITYKLAREDENKFKLLEEQSYRLPINLKQITDEIITMRKQCESIYLKLKKEQLITLLVNVENQQLFQSYRLIGMKYKLLEPMLEKFFSYKKLIQLSWGENPSQYKQFAIEFQKNDDILRIQKMKKIRFNYFHKMYMLVKEHNNQYPIMQLVRTIVQEGCQLIKNQQNAQIRGQILNIIIEVNYMQAQIIQEQHQVVDIQQIKHAYQEEGQDYQDIIDQKIRKIEIQGEQKQGKKRNQIYDLDQ